MTSFSSLEHLNSNNSPFRCNAKELDCLSREAMRFGKETGNYYYGARYYDPKWSIWISVDPLADSPDNIDYSPYAYVWNNPLKYIDPDGRHGQTTIVGECGDGKYEVIGWVDDGSTDVRLMSGEKIGETLTTHTFVNDNDEAVKEAVIDLNDNSGEEFFNQEIANIALFNYMDNAEGGQDLDFKRDGTTKGDADYNNPRYHYRGMSFKGKIASARDVGNYSAGYVAGKSGMSWFSSRKAFDALETSQKYKSKNPLKWRSWEVEGQPTQKAEREGFDAGRALFDQKQLDKNWERAINPLRDRPKW